MSVNTHVQFEDWVHHEMSITELAEAMTEGQMIHMANHLWKHYKVGAQKLVKAAEEDTPDEFMVINGFVYRLGKDDA